MVYDIVKSTPDKYTKEYQKGKIYLIARNSRGYNTGELFFGIDSSNLYYQSGGGGSTHFYQNHTLDYNCNTPLQRNMQKHLIRVDQIAKKEEYLDNPGFKEKHRVWFSTKLKDYTGWDTTVLIRDYIWNEETGEIIFQWGHNKTKTINFDNIKEMFYPNPKENDIINKRLDEATKLLNRAKLIIDENNKEASERNEYSNINIVSDITRFLNK